MENMAKFDGYLILSDMDGTLTTQHGVSKENREAIQYFQKNGGLFTVATGRAPRFISGFHQDFIPNAPVICINGTLVYDMQKDEVIHALPINIDFLPVIEFIMSRTDSLSEVYLHSFSKIQEWKREHFDSLVFPDEVSNNTYYKILFVFDAKDQTDYVQAKLRERYGKQFHFTRSWAVGLEMHIAGSGKGECIPYLTNALPNKIHTTIAVGDYENDLTMIQKADIGYATENAIDSVKKVADKIAPSNQEHCIAHIISELDQWEAIPNKIQPRPVIY